MMAPDFQLGVECHEDSAQHGIAVNIGAPHMSSNVVFMYVQWLTVSFSFDLMKYFTGNSFTDATRSKIR